MWPRGYIHALIMASDICVRFGRRLQRLRTQKGWKQIDLAEHTGMTCTHISKLENGRKEPGLRTLEELAMALEIDLGAMLKKLGGKHNDPTRVSRHGARS